MADDFEVPEPTPLPRSIAQYPGLSERESEVLHRCAQGLTNREIADGLFLNIETVRSHLKRAYQQLGLRNRAEAAAYVHRLETPAQISAPTRLVSRITSTPNLDVDHVDLEAVGHRLDVLGLDGNARRRLAAYAAAADDERTGFAPRQVGRWLIPPETARLADRPDAVERLTEMVRHYVHDLFTGTGDAHHMVRMLETGATNHHLQLLPQWYLASLTHVVCDHLPLILSSASGERASADAIESVIALVSAVLFDAGLVLDGYEIVLGHNVVSRPVSKPTVNEPAAPEPAGAVATSCPTRRQPSLTRMTLDRTEARLRLEFIGLGAAELERLGALAPLVSAEISDVLAEFYARLSGHGHLAELIPPPIVERLRETVRRYWIDLTTGCSDEAWALSSSRMGLLHQQAGLAPQLYLVGAAAQFAALLRKVADQLPDPLASIDALVRALFFDMTFVLDTYLHARAGALHAVHRLADQLITGLATGVVVVNQHNQVEYANEVLLTTVQVTPGRLHHLPLDNAVPLPEIGTLANSARSDGSGRALAVYDRNGRRYRATAMRLDHADAGREGLVAVIVDDVSHLERMSQRVQHERHRLDHVLTSIDALVWEAGRDDFTVLVASSGSVAVLGVRAVDLMGRSLLTEHVHPADRDNFAEICRALEVGQRAQIDHRIRPDTDGVWARTSVVATIDPHGTETICGVTMLAAGEPAAALARHERFGDLLLDHTRASALQFGDATPHDRIEHESFVIERVSPGLLQVLGLREPLAVPVEASDLAQVGWLLRGDVVRHNGYWHLVAIDSIEP